MNQAIDIAEESTDVSIRTGPERVPSRLPVELIVLASVVFGVAGQLVLKSSLLVYTGHGQSTRTSLMLHVGVGILSGSGIYLVGTWFWVKAVSQAHISYLYPLSALGYALVAYGGHVLFGENVSILRWTGIAVICLGSALLVGSSDRGAS